MKKIRIGIFGYGNLGKGVDMAISQNEDVELAGIFTRRPPSTVEAIHPDTKIYYTDNAENMKNDIDVMILCGGSATDLPEQGPQLARMFNTIDSFDTHADIPDYFSSMDKAAKSGGNLSIISVGWDPGMFSINRMYAEAILPNGKDYTFWGKGISQGHSDAIRRIKGVKDAKQYTVPIEKAIGEVRSGKLPELTTRQKHLRECFVVAEKGADLKAIEREIKDMPNYFADYDTVVNFISQTELNEKHSGMPHGGFVIRSGKTGLDERTNQIIEYSLNLESNPEFTASVLVAYARAVYRMALKGETGARTVLDIAPAYLSPKSGEQLRKTLL